MESEGAGYLVVNQTDTDTAIATTDITIPTNTSAHLLYSAGAWEHLLISPSEPEPEGQFTIDLSTHDFAAAYGDGLFHYIATQGRTAPYTNPVDGVRMAVQASAIWGGTVEGIMDRVDSDFYAPQSPGQWVAFDVDPLGEGRRIIPNGFALQHGFSTSDHRLISFDLQSGAGADIASATWSTLSSFTNFSLPATGYSWSAYTQILPPLEGIRFIRILATGVTSSGQHILTLGGIEMDGTIIAGTRGF